MIRVRYLVADACETLDGADAIAATDGTNQRWIQVSEPDPAEIELLVEKLGLHRLSIRDALDFAHPPKLHDFGSHLFFIIHTPISGDEARTRKLAGFLSTEWFLTIQQSELDVVSQTVGRIERDPSYFLGSPALIAHALVDQMANGFEQMADRLHERIGKLEDMVVSRPGVDTIGAIVRFRREVSAMLRVTRGQRDVCMSLARTTHDALPQSSSPLFRDVFDHILRVYDLIDGARDGLSAARDAHLTVVNNRLSEIMRTLTIIATVMMPLSLLAGIYGMNFDDLPLRESAWGFWSVIGLMVTVAGYMLWTFRRRGWF